MGESVHNARFEMRLSQTRLSTIEAISKQVELSASELIRKYIDYCHQESVINALFPCVSGSIYVSGKLLLG